MPRLIHKDSQKILAEEVILAHSPLKRLRGLLGYKSLKQNHAMWIQPCLSVHTFFMKFPIDILFVDKNLRVQSCHENISPWKIVSAIGLHSIKDLLKPAFIKNIFSISVFEFNAGHLLQFSIQKGDLLHVDA